MQQIKNLAAAVLTHSWSSLFCH